MINEVTSIDTIVVPYGAEYKAVCRAVVKAGSQIPVVPMALGTKDIEQTLIDCGLQLESINRLLLVGLCGSLDLNYSPGDAVIYHSCSHLDCHQVSLKSKLTTAIQNKLSLDLVAGITSNRIISKIEEKLQLAKIYPVNVVDMEGYDCVKQLQGQKITVAILRVVSDDLSGDIPNLTKAFDRDGNLKPQEMAIAFLKQPLAALRLIRGSLTGLKELEKTIYQLITSDRQQKLK